MSLPKINFSQNPCKSFHAHLVLSYGTHFVFCMVLTHNELFCFPYLSFACKFPWVSDDMPCAPFGPNTSAVYQVPVGIPCVKSVCLSPYSAAHDTIPQIGKL